MQEWKLSLLATGIQIIQDDGLHKNASFETAGTPWDIGVIQERRQLI